MNDLQKEKWLSTELGELADMIMGQAPPGKDCNKDGKGTPFVKTGEFGEKYPIIREWTTKPLKFAEVRDVLICVVGATCGKLNYGANCAIGRSVAAIRPNNGLAQDFLYYFLTTKVLKLRGDSSGSAQGVISKSSLQEISIQLPPLNEQMRIVAKIEELFSELDSGIESLKTAREKLKVYRQAVLKNAFEGKLTKQWRENNNITKEWATSTLGESGEWKGGGTPSKQNSSYWDDGDILWVSPKDMKSRLIKDTIQKVTKAGVDNSSAKIIKKESVLFVVRSGILRRILPISMAVSDITVNQDMQAMMPIKHSLPFVYWYCHGHEWNIRHECSKDGTTVESIDVSKLKAYPIPVPSEEEQKEIINQIEAILSQIDEMEITIDEEIQKSESLRQSILKQAFSGELVAQDPADEPASVLLERIKAEKQKTSKDKKRKAA